MYAGDFKIDNEMLAEKLKGPVAVNARKLGISRQHLNNILKGHRQPSAGLLLRIQTVFRITPKALIKENHQHLQNVCSSS
jgi:plasmid maintenance system antidote protein VapI